MAAGIYDIIIEQGATFTLSATWKDSAGVIINLTGYSARMQVRPGYESEDILVSLVSSTGITLGGALGTVLATISATATKELTIQEGVYDLELESPGGVVTRLLQGRATISREVTR